MSVNVTTDLSTGNVHVEISRQRGPAGAPGPNSVAGLIQAGSGITITGGGVPGDPAVIAAVGGGGGTGITIVDGMANFTVAGQTYEFPVYAKP